MKITLAIDLGNSAFDDTDNPGTSGTETARILRDLADKLDGGCLVRHWHTRLRDVNGNTVGFAKTAYGKVAKL